MPNYRALLGELLAGLGGVDQRVSGYPYPIQNEVFCEAEAADRGPADAADDPGGRSWAEVEREDAVAAAARWRLLLQLDTDDHVGWSWGDVGRLYFLIRADDLGGRRFDRAVALQQSH